MTKKFTYTCCNKGLKDGQRMFYEQNGYILIKNNVPHDLLDELIANFIDICEGRRKGAALMNLSKDPSLKKMGYKGQFATNKLQDFLWDDVFFKYASYSSVTEVVESIIGPHIVAAHSMLINKPPNADPDYSRHPIHQDLYYFPFRPINTIVGSWTAMEPVNENNGCLYVIPGSHRNGELYKHEYPEGKNNTVYQGVLGFENEPKQVLVMDKGDTVFFHPLLLHGSGVNTSERFRKAISVHFANSNSYFIDTEGTVQEEVMKEIEKLYKLDYMAIWKMKSRNVKGDIGNFRTLPSRL